MDFGAYGPSAPVHEYKKSGQGLALEVGKVVIVGADTLEVGVWSEPSDHTQRTGVAHGLNHRFFLRSTFVLFFAARPLFICFIAKPQAKNPVEKRTSFRVVRRAAMQLTANRI